LHLRFLLFPAKRLTALHPSSLRSCTLRLEDLCEQSKIEQKVGDSSTAGPFPRQRDRRGSRRAVRTLLKGGASAGRRHFPDSRIVRAQGAETGYDLYDPICTTAGRSARELSCSFPLSHHVWGTNTRIGGDNVGLNKSTKVPFCSLRIFSRKRGRARCWLMIGAFKNPKNLKCLHKDYYNETSKLRSETTDRWQNDVSSINPFVKMTTDHLIIQEYFAHKKTPTPLAPPL
jgi:hypothetical protein